MESKVCSKCKVEFLISNFHRASRAKDGYYCWCKQCRRTWEVNKEGRLAYHRNRYHTKKDMYLNSTYLRKFGITLEDYEKMLFKQNNVCAICYQECRSGMRLAVDHCHTTGTVRGLLCADCNKGLGHFKDNIDILNTAISYLQESRR